MKRQTESQGGPWVSGREVPGPGLDILGRQAGLLPVQQPAAEVLQGGQLHLVPVLAVNVQEDAKEHQQPGPDVPAQEGLFNVYKCVSHTR